MNNSITQLHAAWNSATQQHIPMGVCSFELESGWHDFIKAGYNENHMLFVITYLQNEIRKGDRKPAALRWRNCIGDLLRFAEELELAIGASRREPAPTPLHRAMSSLRPTAVNVTPAETQVTAVPVKELIANLRTAAGMPATP